jgi:hypothetical protein
MNEAPAGRVVSQQSVTERAQFRQKLANSVLEQDMLMMVDIAKILHKMPGSSVVAMRNYGGTFFAGLVVFEDNISLTMDAFSEGRLNPARSPSQWMAIPESKLNLGREFINPPEAAVAFFVLTRSGGYALALSHIARSDGDVQWISNDDFILRVADVLVELGVFQEGKPD